MLFLGTWHVLLALELAIGTWAVCRLVTAPLAIKIFTFNIALRGRDGWNHHTTLSRLAHSLAFRATFLLANVFRALYFAFRILAANLWVFTMHSHVFMSIRTNQS